MDYEGWKRADEKTAADLILTGTKQGIETLYKDACDDLIDQHFEAQGNTVLDFACGVGRNSYSLLRKFKNVECYDFPNMINMMEKTAIYQAHKDRVKLFTDWEQVKIRKYDVIFCSLVLQHIYEKDLIPYLRDFKEMSENLYIHTRAYNDDQKKNMYAILREEWKLHPDYNAVRQLVISAREEQHYFIRMISN